MSLPKHFVAFKAFLGLQQPARSLQVRTEICCPEILICCPGPLKTHRPVPVLLLLLSVHRLCCIALAGVQFARRIRIRFTFE
jgi:hypothetical protein